MKFSIVEKKGIPQDNGLLGFRFTKDSNTHYGLADVSWSATGCNGISFTINQWGWNTVADQGINGDFTPVPEPKTFALGLAGLALGAAGIRTFAGRNKLDVRMR